MKRVLMLSVVALCVMTVTASADISPWISFQGVLCDDVGNVVPDDDYSVTFRIYDVNVGGTELWTETQTVSVEGGIFNVYLGSVEPLNTLLFDVPYWLGISVEGETELDPRAPFTTVPYAGHAGYADTVLDADDDWQIDGDDVYHDVGNVGIGTPPIEGRLDVLASDEKCARFMNTSTGLDFTVTGVNNTGTCGGFFSNAIPTSYPAVPAAVFGYGGPSSRGAHFSSADEVGVYASSELGTAILGYATNGYSGYFSGNGLGVYVDDQLETESFKMATGAADGHVLTSDASGVGTWQPSAAVADGDWTISGNDMYSAVSGGVAIGLTYPYAKLDVVASGTDQSMWVRYNGSGTGRVAAISRSTLPTSGNDLLELKLPSASPISCQFIEAQKDETVVFAVDADGWITSEAGAQLNGQLFLNSSSAAASTFETSSTSNTAKAVSGRITGSGTDSDPVGVYGESTPSDGWGVGGTFEGGFMGVRGQIDPSGTDDYYAVYGVANGGAGRNYGVYGYALDGSTNYGVYGIAAGTGTGYAGYFLGDVNVTGTLTGGAKSFKIDHPLDPANKYLLHTSVESDEMMNIYNGNAVLDARGEALVELPEWFEALNRDFRYQLTAVGAPGPNLYVAEKIRGNSFTIAGGEPGGEVSWQVTGVRQDPYSNANRTQVVQSKPTEEVGKYMHPEVYGMPAGEGVGYVQPREIVVADGAEARRSPEVRNRADGD